MKEWILAALIAGIAAIGGVVSRHDLGFGS